MASELGVQTIQHTNGTDALTVGSDGSVSIDRIQIPSFMVTATNTDVAVTGGNVSNLIPFSTVELDTHSGWDATNNRYQPTIAGWYSIAGCVRVNMGGTTTYCAVEIIKNGTDYTTSEAYITQFQVSGLDNGSYPANNALIYLNGTTDYVNLVMRISANATVHDNPTIPSWFCGHLVKAGS